MNIKMCSSCLTVFDSKYLKEDVIVCPIHNCSGDIFEIDETMIPIIRVIRTKGYDTIFCCGGHYIPTLTQHCVADKDTVDEQDDDRYAGAYISIKGEIAYQLFKSMYDKEDYLLMLDKFIYEFCHHYLYGNVVTIRPKNNHFEDYMSEIDCIQLVTENQMAFLKLVNNLPICPLDYEDLIKNS